MHVRCTGRVRDGSQCTHQSQPGMNRCGRHKLDVSAVPRAELTPERARAIIKVLAQGHSVGTAIGSVGISSLATFWDWVARGRLGEEPYAEFLERVVEAQTDARRAVLDVIIAAARKGDARAAEWVAERLWPADYGPRARRPLSDSVVVVTAPKLDGGEVEPAPSKPVVAAAATSALLDQLSAKRERAA